MVFVDTWQEDILGGSASVELATEPLQDKHFGRAFKSFPSCIHLRIQEGGYENEDLPIRKFAVAQPSNLA